MEKHQTLTTTIIRVAHLLLGALATAMIARMLQPERFGEYSFVIAVMTILSMPTAVGLRHTVVREISYARGRAGDNRVNQIWGWAQQRAVWVGVMTTVVLVIWVLWGIRDASLKWHMTLGIGLFLLLPVPKLLGGVLHGLGNTVQSQFPEYILRPVLKIVLLLIVWTTIGDGSVSVTIALMIFAATLAADTALSIAMLKRNTDFSLCPKEAPLPADEARVLTTSSLSFGAIASVHLINSNLDIIGLGFLSTDTEVGLYKAAAVISVLAAFGLGVINTVIMPQIAKLHAQGDRNELQTLITKATRISTVFALGGGLIIWFFGMLILTVVFDESYSSGYWALVILAVGQIANACFGPVALVLNMTGNHRLTLIGVSISVAVNGLLNLLLVPRFGMEGAATATAASLIIWNVLLSIALKMRMGYSCSIFSFQKPSKSKAPG